MKKNLIRIFLLVVILYSSVIVFSQEEPFFSNDSEIFMNQVEAKLLQTKNKRFLEDGQLLINKLKEPWNLGRFNKEEKDYIKAIAEKMQQLKVPDYPDFYNYIQDIQLITVSKQPPSSTLVWFKMAFNLVQLKQLGPFKELLSFTNRFLSQSIIASKSGLIWAARNNQFRFKGDSSLMIHFEKLDLVCASQRDSSIIHNTSGVYNVSDAEWIGEKGRVDWWRFGYNPQTFYVELSNYAINLNQNEYHADSVAFIDKSRYSGQLFGRFSDKVMSSPPSARTSYPRFSTYLSDYELNNIFPDVDFIGRISVEGGTVFGQGSENKNAELVFNADKQTIAKLKAVSFNLGTDKLTSSNVIANILINGDSLFHPELRMRYTNVNRRLMLYRSDEGVGEAPFSDSYHKVDLYFEALNWDIDANEMTFSKLDGVSQESKGWIESQNYFSDREFQFLKGMDDLHPMVMIDNYLQVFDLGNVVQLNAYADYIKKPAEQVITQFLRLASKGFLVFDPNTQIAVVNERFYNVLAAKSGKSDYDVIKLQSFTKNRNPNVSLDLKTKNLIVYGVSTVILSDTQNVVIKPNEECIVLKKNRNFTFSGLVNAGLFTYYARDCSFEYDKFQLNFAYIDSISFLVRTRDVKENEDNQRFTKVKNVLANLTGTLSIDDPYNKSGLHKFSHFPVFESKGESYVYFDKPQTQQGLLKRDSFYYIVDPFIIDSLMTFSTDELKFEGSLTSAGILPIFSEPLIVMEDYSLGFTHKTKDEGYALFGDKAMYYNNLHLSNKGFFGNGRIEYLTSIATTDTFNLYPDSITGRVNEFVMKEKTTSIEFPQGQADTIAFRWISNPNMVYLSTIANPYIAFNNSIVEGDIQISPFGMTGNGKVSFSNAEILSDSINFLSQSFSSDTADFHLFTAESNQEAFAALRYKVKIDFKERRGNFKFMQGDGMMSFPFNQYICTLDEADWLMDEDKLVINNNRVKAKFELDKLKINQIIDIDLSGSEFVSTNPTQDSLSFFCLEAEYDLIKYMINARNVKIIRVADAAIFPNDGMVRIEQGALMDTLRSATIITNLKTRYHIFTDAVVSIKSRKNYTGNGNYCFYDQMEKLQQIAFNSIWVDSIGQTNASAEIFENEPITLNKVFDIFGKISMQSSQRHLFYDGGFRIKESCSAGNQPYAKFDTIIDPVNIKIPIHNPTDLQGIRLQCGLYLGMNSNSYYGSFLKYPQSVMDKVIFEESGNLTFDNTTNTFKIDGFQPEPRKQLMQLKTDRCIMSGKGKLEFGNKMEFVDIQTIGLFDYKMIPDSIAVNLFLKINFNFDQTVMNIMSDSLNAANLKGVNLSQGNYLSAVSQILNAQESQKVFSDISLYGSPRKLPDALANPIVIADVNMVYNQESKTFTSKGPIGIGNLYGVSVNKYVNGYFEIEKGKSYDSFRLYLQPTAQQWFYFDFKGGVLQAISSSNDFNNELMAIKQEKRVSLNIETGEQYEYVISTRRKVVDFLRRMQPENQ